MEEIRINEINEKKLKEISIKTGYSEEEVLNGIMRTAVSPKISKEMADFAAKKADEMRGRAGREKLVNRPQYYQAMEDYEKLEEIMDNA